MSVNFAALSREKPKKHRRLSQKGGVASAKKRRERELYNELEEIKQEMSRERLAEELRMIYESRNEHICPAD